jgi:hypothetical protein
MMSHHFGSVEHDPPTLQRSEFSVDICGRHRRLEGGAMLGGRNHDDGIAV